jgi:hypothetical protein
LEPNLAETKTAKGDQRVQAHRSKGKGGQERGEHIAVKHAMNQGELVAKKLRELRSKNSILKEGVLQERKRSEQLASELTEKSTQNRQQLAELDSLRFTVERLTKRCDKLKNHIRMVQEEAAKKAEGGTWLGSLLATGSSAPQEKIAKDLQVMEHELQAKITESQRVQSEMILIREEHATTVEVMHSKIERLRQEVAHLQERLQATEKNELRAVRLLRQEQQARQVEVQDLKESLKQTRDELLETAKASTRKLAAMNRELKLQSMKLTEKVPFDDTLEPSLSALNLFPFQRSAVLRQLECLDNFSKLFLKIFSGTLRLGRVVQASSNTIFSAHKFSRKSHEAQPSAVQQVLDIFGSIRLRQFHMLFKNDWFLGRTSIFSVCRYDCNTTAQPASTGPPFGGKL